MVPADSDRVPLAPPYSGYKLDQHLGQYGTLTLFGHVSQHVLVPMFSHIVCPTTPTLPKQDWFGLFPVRSPLLRESLLFSLPPGT